MMKPAEIAFDKGLWILWTSDSAWVRIPYIAVRFACPCAVCVDEISGEKKIDITQIPLDIHPKSCEYVGNYGLRIHWSDQHSTGIFPYAYLKAVCQDLKLMPSSNNPNSPPQE